MEEQLKVAVVQAASVFADKAASTQKAVDLIGEAGSAGAKLIVFPETFISGYPRGFAFGSYVGERRPEGRDDWSRYWRSAVRIPDESIQALTDAASAAGAYIVIGVVEQDETPPHATLYNTTLYIGPNGALLGKHRKIKPTGVERLIYGEGDGSTLTAIETPYGCMGGLICWENYMPLARMAMYGKGVKLYITPTADARDSWQATIRHIACEGRCFVLSCNQYFHKAMYPTDLACYDELAGTPDNICRGGSAIVDPFGNYVAEPLYDQEGILYANLDLTLIERGHLDFDVVGHYARPDIFSLTINEQPQQSVIRNAK
ncbi:MAG: carbon-nitrogen hydrolase family protein [Chloroflexi bacterium]|nr:MAG: nitrilase [Phototrophicales bacterium]RMF79706.1 MAG: carbon-nitrogen hydrolase family protein [Chloroflexota bacterium]